MLFTAETRLVRYARHVTQNVAAIGIGKQLKLPDSPVTRAFTPLRYNRRVNTLIDFLSSTSHPVAAAGTSLPDALAVCIAFAAAVIAGAMNSVAGGGTLVSFPALVLVLGLDPIRANATNSMSLWPASLTGALGFREMVKGKDALIIPFSIVSLIGGVIGAVLLYFTPPEQFKVIVPWLILMAVALFLLQEKLVPPPPVLIDGAQAAEFKGPSAGNLAFQFLVAVYGGYFGAGIGILMLAALGFMRIGDIYRMSYVKNFCALIINLAASVTLAIQGLIDWPVAVIMTVGACVGGYAGAGVAKKIGAKNLRRAISIIGLIIAAYMLYKQFA